MSIFTKILWKTAIGVALFASVSCQRDPIPDIPGDGPVLNENGMVSMRVSIGQEPIPETKGSMLDNDAVESVGSGAIILVYADGALINTYYFSQAQINNQASEPLEIEAPLGICDFFVLGNLNGINKSSGARVDLLSAYGESTFATESSIEGLVYLLDGGSINSTYRRQTMAEVGSYGLPYQCISKNVNTEAVKYIPGSNTCKRLFSKVSVTIDHAAFDGGSSAKLNDFVNKSVYMRQVNAKMMPFTTNAVKATSSSDLVQGAYNDAMSNASRGTYVFYIPENRQGTVATITTPTNKTSDNVPSSIRPYVTYVEFTGTLNKSSDGFQGDVTYKFYLGANNTSDFNVERGKNYAVTLSFLQGSLFNPYWKVNANLSDGRLFSLMADAACTTDISVPTSNTRNLLVRKSRPGAMYVYMNPSGNTGSANALIGKSYSTSETMPVSSLSDCSWYSSFVAPGSADATWLSDRGISVGWDSSNAKLSFTVTNPSKFNSYIGDSRSLSLKLLPNGSTVSFNLVLSSDMTATVSGGLSLVDDFYLGQKRTVSVSGFQGSTIKYAAVQKKCGSSSSSALNSNVQWKTVNTGSTSSGFPSCALDGSGNVIYDPSNSAYSGQTYSGSLDIYAWYPNRFQSSHSGWSSEVGKIVFFSEDWLNDMLEVNLRISEPRMITSTYSGTYRLPLDGTPFSISDFGYKTFDGSSWLTESNFDATLYSSLLTFSTGASSDLSDCVGIDIANKKIYCSDSYSSTYGDLSAKTLSNIGIVYHEGYALLGEVYVYPNSATGLWSGYVFRANFDFTAPIITAVEADGSSWSTGSKTTVKVNYFKTNINPFEDDESFWINAKYYFTNSDLASLNIAPVGNKTTYTVGSTTYEPIYEIQATSYDAGSGGELRWVYDESKQAKQAPTGEKIPGGLLLPYGEQRIYFTFTNRHSGREVTIDSGKYVTLLYNTPFVYFVGATNQRYARIFQVPAKNVKYLKRCASTADLDQRTWMTTLFGHRAWSDAARVQRAYPYVNMGISAFHDTYSLTNPGKLPLTNFDARYVPGASSTANKWILSYIYLLDDRIPTNGYNSPFVPPYFSDFLITLYEVQTFNGPGFEEDSVALIYGKDDPTSAYGVWWSTNSMYGAVQGYYLDTNQSFAR